MVCVDRLAVVLWAAAVAAASAYPKVGDSRLVTMNDDDPLKCELYNSSCIAEASARGNSKEKCTGVEHCANRQAHYCIATWSPVAGNGTAPPNDGHRSGHQVHHMGCFNDPEFSGDCYKTEECSEHKPNPKAHFCCCSGDMCNSQFRWAPHPEDPTTPRPKVPGSRNQTSDVMVAVYCLAAVFVVCLVGCLFAFVCYTKRKAACSGARGENGCGVDGEGMALVDGVPASKLTQLPVDLERIVAKGRFGAVWKGRVQPQSEKHPGEAVAVKVFQQSNQDRESWLKEKEIFELPRMEHDSILKFMGVDIKDIKDTPREYWLLTKFHDNGSLCDFLKSNTLSYGEMCWIAHSMASGLAHLHEELQPKGTLDIKPAVAHRDFKSKNVLIKSDMTACIADFGLGLIFVPGESVGDTHPQVGTRRYMAPEVLEGAITFNRDSFLRIDMYACGLVLWELASRCRVPGLVDQPAEYMLPFEEECSRPTLEQMQELVVTKKVRPKILPAWVTSNPSGGCDYRELVSTIKDCWDQDAEARLSASNVMERINSMREQQQQQHNQEDDIPAYSAQQPNNAAVGSLNVTPGEERSRNLLNEQQVLEANMNQRNVADSTANSGGEQHEMTPLIISSQYPAAAVNGGVVGDDDDRGEV